MDTCGTMYGWKHSTNTMCWIDRLNIVNSHRTNKVNSGKQGLAKKEKGLCKCLGAKFPGQKRAALGKGLLLALVRDLNGRALTLLEKDLDAVVHKSEEETEETGSETVKWSNGGKSAWFNLKDILQVFINWLCFLLVISLKKIFRPISESSVAFITDSDSLIFPFWIKCSLSWQKSKESSTSLLKAWFAFANHYLRICILILY